MSDQPAIQFVIPLCPWCGADMLWLKARSDLDHAKTVCEACKRPVVVTGKMTITIEAEKAPWLQAVGEEG